MPSPPTPPRPPSSFAAGHRTRRTSRGCATQRPTDVYAAYLKERPGNADSTAFFLDAADMLFERGQADARRARAVQPRRDGPGESRRSCASSGQRLMQAERPKLALPVFRKVLDLAPDEPQSYRDLGLAYAADGQRAAGGGHAAPGGRSPWNARFPEIELVALAELNAIVATSPQPLDDEPRRSASCCATCRSRCAS